MDEKTSRFSESYFLLKVKPTCSDYPSLRRSSEDRRLSNATSSQKLEKRLEGFFLKAGQMVKLDPNVVKDLTTVHDYGRLANTSF